MAVFSLRSILLASSVALGLLTEGAHASPRTGFRNRAIPRSNTPSWRRSPPSPSSEKRAEDSASGVCDGSPDVPTVEAPHINIWDSLTKCEVVGLLEWLHRPEHGLNLTTIDKATAWDNTVGVTELLMPNKTDALTYIDEDGPLPVRNARVGIFVGATEEPYMQTYVVGPLPVSNRTKIAPLEYIYTKGSGRMPNYDADAVAVYYWQTSVAASIADITEDLLGIVTTGAENDTAIIGGLDPLQKEDDRIIDWIGFYVNPTLGFSDGTILPAGFYLKFDITGRDPEKWRCIGALYNDIFYETLDDLRAAWEKPDFVRLPKVQDGEWGSTARQGEELPYDERPGPAIIEPARRYAIDKKSKFVRWMDFEFFLAFDRDTGLKFYEIKYKGERIIFELGIQEAHAHYAANNPLQSGSAFLDSWYGLGSVAFSLVPGWDCPASATYLDMLIHDNSVTTTHNGSVCIFEQDPGYPISRHTPGTYTTVTKNAQLVVRWYSIVGNYDYMIEYVFSLDGTIEVKVRASGYIQGAYYAHNEEYGYKIHDALSGAMHDHVVNFKLDLDVNGTANSLEKVEFVPHTTQFSWAKEPRNTMKIKKSFITNEDESKLNWGLNSAASYVVVNKDKPNPYGEFPGYKISPNLGSPVYLTVRDSSTAKKAVSFATHNLFVTKQKDTEPRSAAAWNNQDPENPLVNFEEFFDGESLDQEDLVVWFNLGMHHVPHTGDLPNTVYTTAQAGIAISPHNYLLGDPSRQTSHSVYVDLTGEKAAEKSYGGERATCAYDLNKLYPDLSGYAISEAVRKWPQVYVGGGS